MSLIGRFYARNVFPCLCDLALRRREVVEQRSDVLAAASGRILEIGLGTGLNLTCYPAAVTALTALEPNGGMRGRALKRSRATAVDVDWQAGSATSMPFDADSFDCVVSTWTLCSITPVREALAEVHRVLKPGGRLLFLEHGLSPAPKVQRRQRRIEWLSVRFADGCHLTRPIGALLAEQPFADLALTELDLRSLPSTHGHVYRGVATK